jgi:PAS domain S-box-containing protein
MTNNIFTDFEDNREYTARLLDSIPSAVALFTISSEIKFIHFNHVAEELLGYGEGQLISLTDGNPMELFHPDHENHVMSQLIAAMMQGQMLNYNCQMRCGDGTYKWINMAARLVQQKNGTLYYQSVLTPIKEPDNIMLQGFHALIVMGDDKDGQMLMELIEHYGGTCDIYKRGGDALERFTDSDDGFYSCAFIGCRMKDMNGFEMAKDIRFSEHPQAKTIPLLLVTDTADHAEEAVDIGITAYIRKPLSPKKITKWLKTLNK